MRLLIVAKSTFLYSSSKETWKKIPSPCFLPVVDLRYRTFMDHVLRLKSKIRVAQSGTGKVLLPVR